jgi:hypothetical protein
MNSEWGIHSIWDLGLRIADLTAKRKERSVKILRIIDAILFALQNPASSIEQPATINDFNDLNELNDQNQ